MVSSVLPAEDLIWGGDWNQELQGRLWAGTKVGRDLLCTFLSARKLQVPTAGMGSVKGDRSVNHIAVPAAWSVTGDEPRAARLGSRRLSDHDPYVVECEIPSRGDLAQPGSGCG